MDLAVLLSQEGINVFVNVGLLALLIMTALAAVLVRNLLVSCILLNIFSFLMASQYLVLKAPDVAITEAAVGAGVSTILILSALMLTGEKEKKPQLYGMLPLLVVVITGGALVYATLNMPAYGVADAPAHQHVGAYYIEQSYEDIAIPNIVTSVLASYRGFDTLGEVIVILTAALCCLLLLAKRYDVEPEEKKGKKKKS